MKLTRSLAAAGLLTLTVLAVGNSWTGWVRAVLGLGWFIAVVLVFDHLARQDRHLHDLEQLQDAQAGRAALARCVHYGGTVDGTDS